MSTPRTQLRLEADCSAIEIISRCRKAARAAAWREADVHAFTNRMMRMTSKEQLMQIVEELFDVT